jgi:hypothetical protein
MGGTRVSEETKDHHVTSKIFKKAKKENQANNNLILLV